MSKEATRNALATIAEDADAAVRVAAGDFDSLDDTDTSDLTDAERSLLQAAASDLASNDVSGFAMDLGGVLRHGNITLDNGIKYGDNITLDNGIKFMPAVRDTLGYLSGPER